MTIERGLKLKVAMAAVESRRGAFIQIKGDEGREALVPNGYRSVRVISLTHIPLLKLIRRLRKDGYRQEWQRGGGCIWRPIITA